MRARRSGVNAYPKRRVISVILSFVSWRVGSISPVDRFGKSHCVLHLLPQLLTVSSSSSTSPQPRKLSSPRLECRPSSWISTKQGERHERRRDKTRDGCAQ